MSITYKQAKDALDNILVEVAPRLNENLGRNFGIVIEYIQQCAGRASKITSPTFDEVRDET